VVANLRGGAFSVETSIHTPLFFTTTGSFFSSSLLSLTTRFKSKGIYI